MRPTFVTFAAFLALSGCSDAPDYAYAEGDACRTLDDFCVDTNVAMQCIDDRWEARDCQQFCQGLGEGVTSSGCETTSARNGECVCVPPPDGCTPGDSVCANEEEVSHCTDAWEWSTHSCSEVCASHPTHTTSNGCATDESGVGVCLCTTEGTACSDQSPVCVDQTTISICENGAWSQMPCAELCDEDQAICEPELGVGAACICE